MAGRERKLKCSSWPAIENTRLEGSASDLAILSRAGASRNPLLSFSFSSRSSRALPGPLTSTCPPLGGTLRLDFYSTDLEFWDFAVLVHRGVCKPVHGLLGKVEAHEHDTLRRARAELGLRLNRAPPGTQSYRRPFLDSESPGVTRVYLRPTV